MNNDPQPQSVWREEAWRYRGEHTDTGVCYVCQRPGDLKWFEWFPMLGDSGRYLCFYCSRLTVKCEILPREIED